MQAAFARALLAPDSLPPAGVVDPVGRPAPQRFAVYRNNVAVGLVRALEQAFPVVRRLVGDEFFAAMALVYLRAHPPRGPVLATYGADFAAFLDGFPPVAALGYLPDVARLEMALRDSYHAADAAPVAVERLTALAPEALMACRLRLAPSLRWLRSGWPVASIWRANTSGGAAPALRAEDVVILRPGFDPEPHVLPDGGADALDRLQQGATVAEAMETTEGGAALLTLLLQGQAIVEVLP